jgi:hypothetical protein
MPISPARRRQAIADSTTFAVFVDCSTNFTSEFRENYAAAELDDRDRQSLSSLSKIDGSIDVLAIVEDWCPDVVAN